MSKTRIGVIGVGHHGRHHARNLAAMSNISLVGVVDAYPDTARHVAELCQTRAFAEPSELWDIVDAVVIAVPTASHAAVAAPFLKRGIATLVEKPISFSIDQARDMVRLSKQHQVPLMVGHIERFNPVWGAVKSADIRPRFIETARLSRFPFRSLDVSVVFDVMIHDIDLVRTAARSRVRRIEAIGSASVSPSLDWATVQIEFENNVQAHLTASRVHHTNERRLAIRSDRACLELDFLRRTSTLHQLTAGAKELLGKKLGPLTAEEKELLWRDMFSVHSEAHARAIEPLRLELEEFIAAAQERRDPSVTGEDGLESILVATEIERTISAGQTTLRASA
ncbi:Gfo/Idh/MocA family oxidoreductase [bacterium]|jgi:predicted dehydrogenase|nr:Gfo/Idh/MocA family oxidoreductase [bacterium]